MIVTLDRVVLGHLHFMVESFMEDSVIFLLHHAQIWLDRCTGQEGPEQALLSEEIVAFCLLFCISHPVRCGVLKQHHRMGCLGCPLESHPLRDALSALESILSKRLLHPQCVKDGAVRLYKEHCAIFSFTMHYVQLYPILSCYSLFIFLFFLQFPHCRTNKGFLSPNLKSD